MGTLKADTITAQTTNGNVTVQGNGTGGVIIDGMPHRNLIINGDMRIAQRGTSFVSAANGIYTLDRWRWRKGSGTGVVTITQDTDVPTVAEAGTDFKNSLKIDVTTADASLASNDGYGIEQSIEGFNFAHLGAGAANARTVMLSFWVKSTKTGTFHVGFLNGANNRGYPASYTVDATNTWEKKTLAVAMDTTGTWVGATNDIGVQLRFTLAVGTDYEGTANTWNTGTAQQSASGAANAMDNTANNFLITGVQLEAGSVATAFEHRDYGSELARCQRYYYRIKSHGTASYLFMGHVKTTTSMRFMMIHPTTMRASPTFAHSGASDFRGEHAATTSTPSALSAAGDALEESIMLSATVPATTAGQSCNLYMIVADAYIEVKAEL